MQAEYTKITSVKFAYYEYIYRNSPEIYQIKSVAAIPQEYIHIYIYLVLSIVYHKISSYM